MTSELRYNPYTGTAVTPGETDSVQDAVRLGLEPPRYCAECGRRMVVQVLPNGWTSLCSRHGAYDSSALGQR